MDRKPVHASGALEGFGTGTAIPPRHCIAVLSRSSSFASTGQ